MKLLLIGGSGFLGTELLYCLLSDKNIEKIYCVAHHAPLKCSDTKISVLKGDITDLDSIHLPERIDGCVIASGVTNGRSASEKETFRINYIGTKKAISFCQKHKINEIFFTSSINVKLKKKGAYAKSKLLAENVIRKSKLKYVIFRPALIYGYHQKLGLGVIERCIQKYGIVPVFGDGQKLEQPVFVKECAAIMAYYISHGADGQIVEILGRDAYSYNELCQQIGMLLGKNVHLVHFPVKPFEMALTLIEKMHIPFPISAEQIYHIDSDLNGNMERIYQETGIMPQSFTVNFSKEKQG